MVKARRISEFGIERQVTSVDFGKRTGFNTKLATKRSAGAAEKEPRHKNHKED